MPERVLPWRGISVFDVVARTASFNAAALELNLSPSAVSHQIRLLEEYLGIALFDRVGRGVKLTADGAEYARSVRQSIRQLSTATNDVKARGNGAGMLEVVRVETPPSFARCWLLPRLPHILAEHPGLDLRINAEGSPLQGGRLPWPQAADAPPDVQIVYGGNDLWEDRAALLVTERIEVYCAPSLLERTTVTAPEQLPSHTLISTSQNAMSWEDWFALQGVDWDGNAAGALQIDPSHLAIAAAANAMGFILESSVLVEGDPATSLRSAFPEAVVPGLSYWVFTPSAKRARPAVDAIIEWFKRALPGAR